jgi:hypothetical protein
MNIKNTIYRSLNVIKKTFGESLRKDLKVRKIEDPESQVFFGYYDITPFSHDSRRLLAMHAPLENSTPSLESEIKVGYYDLTQEVPPFIEIGRTTTWCWQQGCRLQWYPQNNGRSIFYNRLINGQYGSVIQDIDSKDIIQEYNAPIYSVSRDGRWGLSLNFSRLQRMRPGYGYVNFPDDTDGRSVPEDDGIWKIDMETEEKVFLFSVAEISRIEPLESMKGAEHYFNHILFNPGGTRFMFIHLWVRDGKRYGRMITCNIDGNEKYALINEGHTSHYTWRSDDELLVYASHADTGINYNLYRDRTSSRKVIGKSVISEDGHPSFLASGPFLLTDTYPDRLRNQKLLLYNIESNALTCVNSYFTPSQFTGEVRCDLHPRISPDEKLVCIDSAHENKRAMYVLDISPYLDYQKGD